MMGTEQSYLLLRLEAPLMAFGAPMVDAIGPTARLPGRSQLAGLLGNALGYTHGQAETMSALQQRLRFAAMLVRPGVLYRDYQTVDLGRPHLVGTGWTTRNQREERKGASGESTHIRERWYLADAQILVALTLSDEDQPDLPTLAASLDSPARPLFIGRKPCLPTHRLRLGEILIAPSYREAFAEGLRRLGSPAAGGEMELDAELESTAQDTELRTDLRDWHSKLHNGSRMVVRSYWPAEAGSAL